MMTSITLDYNKSSALANSILQVIRQSGEFIVHTPVTKEVDEYDEDFVNQILASDKSAGKRMKVEDIWN